MRSCLTPYSTLANLPLANERLAPGHRLSRSKTARIAIAGLAIAGIALGSPLSPLLAQDQPADFSLPAETPASTPASPPASTPTAAPQGPVDERAGVPIAPRIIPQDRAVSRTPPAPSPSPSAQAARRPAAQTTRSQSERAQPAPARPSPAVSGTASAARGGENAGLPTLPEPSGDGSAPAGPTVSDDASQIGPGFSTDLLGGDNQDPLIGADEWVDVTPSPSIDLGPSRAQPASGRSGYVPTPQATNWGLLMALALCLIALALIVAIAWRARRKAPVAEIENDLAKGVRREMLATYGTPLGEQPQPKTPEPTPKPTPDPRQAPKPDPQAAPAAAPKPAPSSEPVGAETPTAKPAPAHGKAQKPADQPHEPLNLAVTLNIVSATRSVMMFSLEYRLALANRSDHAVRDIAVSARLVSAQRGSTNAAPVGAGQAIATIDRLGPQQSRSITAKMQLPMAEVRALRQGETPVFIPLLHVTLEGLGQRATTKTFVIGTQSETSQLRLHPIALDTPPGSVSDLRANELRAPIASEPA